MAWIAISTSNHHIGSRYTIFLIPFIRNWSNVIEGGKSNKGILLEFFHAPPMGMTFLNVFDLQYDWKL